jgi:FkbM family methyltransferase
MKKLIRWIEKLYKTLGSARKYPNCEFFGAPLGLTRLKPERFKASIKGFYSQAGQDEFVYSRLFHVINNPNFTTTFLDVGCNHPKKFSNSYFFDKNLGFKVYAIDAIDSLSELWKRERPRAQFITTAVGSSVGTVRFRMIEGEAGSLFSSIDRTGRTQSEMGDSTVIDVRVDTLGNILKSLQLEDVGILSLDVEGGELAALKGVDWSTQRIRIIMIENTDEKGLGDDVLRTFLVEKGYVYIARFWNLDDIFIERKLLSVEPC